MDSHHVLMVFNMVWVFLTPPPEDIVHHKQVIWDNFLVYVTRTKLMPSCYSRFIQHAKGYRDLFIFCFSTYNISHYSGWANTSATYSNEMIPKINHEKTNKKFGIQFFIKLPHLNLLQNHHCFYVNKSPLLGLRYIK